MRISLCVHVYYPDVLGDMAPTIRQVVDSVDLCLTCRDEAVDDVRDISEKHGLSPRFIDVFENRGMDVLPFLRGVQVNRLYESDVVIKLHTKNNVGRGAAHLQLMLDSLIGNPECFSDLCHAFRTDPALAMAGPDLLFRASEDLVYGNRRQLEFLQKLLRGSCRPLRRGFFAGTAFWVRGSLLKPLCDVLPEVMAEEERESLRSGSGRDGTIAHALERFWGELSDRPDAKVGLIHRALPPQGPRFWLRTELAVDAQAELGRDIPPVRTTERLHRMQQDYALLSEEDSSVFDAAFYAEHYGQQMRGGVEPLQHFVEWGEILGLSPSPGFHVPYYRMTNPELSEQVNCAAHFVRFGSKQEHKTKPTRAEWFNLAKRRGFFDQAWYRQQFADVPSRMSADAHYKRFGDKLRRPCSRAFDPTTIPALAPATEEDAPSAVVRYMSTHCYPEKLLYDKLTTRLREEDICGAEMLSHQIEDTYGSTDALLVARAYCLVRRGEWDEAFSIMQAYWQRRSIDQNRFRHTNRGVPEKTDVSMFEEVSPRRRSITNARICVYTASFGDRSELPPNVSSVEGVDFICFTERPQKPFGWEIRVETPRFSDPNLSAKYYKILPHLCLPEYDYSLFVDANTFLCGRLKEWLEFYLADERFVMWTHPDRSDLYREMFAISEGGRHRPDEVFEQMRVYFADGLPPKSGMVEASCIWRKHSDRQIAGLMDRWWAEILQYSRRDQLSLGYLFWRTGVRPRVFRSQGVTSRLGHSRRNRYFVKLPHGRLPRKMRAGYKMPVTFLYSEAFKGSGSTVMRGAQLSEYVREYFSDREVTFESGRDYSGRILFLTKGYLAKARPGDLERLKKRGNYLLADYVDARPVAAQIRFIDALVASSLSALMSYRQDHPRKSVFHITHHVDPRLKAGNSAKGLRMGYIGERVNAVWTPAVEAAVKCVQVDTSKVTHGWLDEVGDLNLHYAVRRVRGADGHKPFLKGFTAAYCGANIVIQAGSGDADYYLGMHYPYLLPAKPSEEAILAMLERVRSTYGGTEWKFGLDVMREIRERSSVLHIMREFGQMLECL